MYINTESSLNCVAKGDEKNLFLF